MQNKSKMKRIFESEDGYVWHLLTESEARRVIDSGIFKVHALNDDGEEIEITDSSQIESHIRRGEFIGIGVGYYNDIEN